MVIIGFLMMGLSLSRPKASEAVNETRLMLSIDYVISSSKQLKYNDCLLYTSDAADE